METLDRRPSHSTALMVAIAITAGALLLAGSVALGMLRPDAWGRSGPDDSTHFDYSRKSDPLGRLSEEYVESQSQGDAAGAGSSTAKGSRSGGSLPADTISQDPETAGPPVYYTDQADDAYGTRAQSPNAALSQPAFDILRVDWGPASQGYSTSITVAGVPRDDGWYVSYGLFYASGEKCQLYHFLNPGIRAFANAFCGWVEDGSRRFIGRVEGDQVTSTQTTAGGTVLVATFDNRAIPPLLQAAGRRLYILSAFTCLAPGHVADGLRCSEFEVKDQATSPYLTYRV